MGPQTKKFKGPPKVTQWYWFPETAQDSGTSIIKHHHAYHLSTMSYRGAQPRSGEYEIMYEVWRWKVKITAAVYTTTTILWPFFWEHPGEPVPEENFWNFWCKGRLTEADTNHPSGRHSIRTNQCSPPLSPHCFFTGRMPFLPPNQQCQSTEGLAHSDQGEDARVLLNGVTCTVSGVLTLSIISLRCKRQLHEVLALSIRSSRY